MPEPSWRAALLSRLSVEKKLTFWPRYSYSHFHW